MYFIVPEFTIRHFQLNVLGMADLGDEVQEINGAEEGNAGNGNGANVNGAHARL